MSTYYLKLRKFYLICKYMFILTFVNELCVVVHTCKFSTGELKQNCYEFKASLRCRTKLCLITIIKALPMS